MCRFTLFAPSRVLLLPAVVLLMIPKHSACQTMAKFRTWDSVQLRNQYIQVNVTAQLGGRILNYQLGDHTFLWWNRGLEGQVPPKGGLGRGGTWLNWGGDKLWPAPQGWDGDAQWPGPPDGILDGSPHEVQLLPPSRGKEGLQLTSLPDPRSGIMFSRTIRIFDGSSRVHVSSSMTNIVQRPVRWGIWTNTQLDARDRNGPGWNNKFYTYAPVNTLSKLPGGHRIFFGPEINPQVESDPRSAILKLHFEWMMGKVGLDSDGGWLANVDGSTGYVFVQMFAYQPEKQYPDDISLAVWTNGLGTLRAYGKTEAMPTDPVKKPLHCGERADRSLH